MSSIVFAADTPTPTYPYNLWWNIGNIYYWVDSNALEYDSHNSSASYNWFKTGWYNKLYPNSKASNKSSVAIDYYKYNDSSDSSNAYTSFTLNTSSGKVPVYPTNSNWSFN